MTAHYKDGRFCGGCIRPWHDHALSEVEEADRREEVLRRIGQELVLMAEDYTLEDAE